MVEMASNRKRLASEGGRARAAALTPEERKQIAVTAAEARWGALPTAKYAAILKIGEMEFPCAVLSDGQTRVLTQNDFMRGMGMYYSGWVAQKRRSAVEDTAADVPLFLSFESLKPFADKHLGDLQTLIVKYRTEGSRVAHGIRAEIIPKICDVWIDADEQGSLGRRQKQVAAKARLLMRALAHVGIIALIDEVTGFQAIRDQDALAKFLEQYIAKELRKWVRTFPREFFQQLCRLKGIQFPDDMRLPPYFGKIINDLVYDRLAPGVREELNRVNPTNEKGRRRHRHHQWLTEDVGHPKLLHHLGILTGLAYGFGPGEYDDYYRQVGRVLPNHVSLPLFLQANMERRKAIPEKASARP
jgi:hypothetical protein